VACFSARLKLCPSGKSGFWVTAADGRGFFRRRHSGDAIKESRRGGMPGLTNLRQGSGMTPDSGKTVLGSGVGRCYRQLPVRERVRREAASCRNRILIKRYSRSVIGYKRCDFFLSRSTLVEVTLSGCHCVCNPSVSVSLITSNTTCEAGRDQNPAKFLPGLGHTVPHLASMRSVV
jgi:hypothetical protein